MNESNFLADSPPEVEEAFASAAITVLQELARFEATWAKTPAITAVEMPNAISASMRLARQIPGRMTLVLAEEAASRLAARYLPQGTLLSEEIVDDVCGEFANVIAGQAKTILKGTPYHFTLSTPVVDRLATFSQVPGIEKATLIAWLTFEASRLLLLVDLPPCPGS